MRIVVFVLSVVCLFLAGCKQSSPTDLKIIEGKLRQFNVYIPKAYLKFRHTSIGDESALIQAWYPGAAIPPSNDSLELAKQKLWKNNI